MQLKKYQETQSFKQDAGKFFHQTFCVGQYAGIQGAWYLQKAGSWIIALATGLKSIRNTNHS